MLIATLKNTKASQTNLHQYLHKHGIEVDPHEYFDTTGKQGWFLGSGAEFALKQKIESVGKPLKDWDVKIYRGVLTGLNEAFIIDEEKKNELIAKDPKSAEIIKPILRGRDIKRYGYEFAELYLINVHNGYKKEIPLLRGGTEGDGVVFAIDVNGYPAIKDHLDQFEPALSKRQDKGKTQYNLRNCAYYEEFAKEKVVYSEIVREPQFYLDKSGEFFAEATTFLMTGENLKFMCGVLNSKAFTYFFKNYYAGGGLGESGYRYKKAFLETVPIPILDTPEKQAIAGRIEALVEQILEVKKSPFQRGESSDSGCVSDTDHHNTPSVTSGATFLTGRTIHLTSTTPATPQEGNTDTTHLESQIDDLVFELYGLSGEERKVVLHK